MSAIARYIWLALVNGEVWSLFWWAALLVFDLATARWVDLLVDAPLLLLNLYSWDFQRRQRAGGGQ